MLNPPDSGAIDRFRHDLNRAASQAIKAGVELTRDGRLGIAVSGGPDSVALLLLAVAAVSSPSQVVAATFDHQLRDESASEAAGVVRLCAELGVHHATLTPQEPITGSSIQMRAREARYAALTAWSCAEGADALLTGHHADDAAETLLMRLNRASGLAGLAGIRSHRFDNGVLIVRPLLGWRRADLGAIVAACGATAIDDPSNYDGRYDRTRVRGLLAATPSLDVPALAASARFLAEAEQVVTQMAARAWTDGWDGRTSTIALDDLPRELRRRLVRRAIMEVRDVNGIVLPRFDEASNVEAALDAMEEGRGVVQGGVQLRRVRGGWHVRVAPPRRSG